MARHECVGCGKVRPFRRATSDDTEDDGWRIERTSGADSARLFEWRCPACIGRGAAPPVKRHDSAEVHSDALRLAEERHDSPPPSRVKR